MFMWSFGALTIAGIQRVTGGTLRFLAMARELGFGACKSGQRFKYLDTPSHN